MAKRKHRPKKPRISIDYDVVVSICKSVVKGTPDEDFVQDVCVKILEKQDSFSGKSAWKTWVYAVARNLWISKKRHIAIEERYLASKSSWVRSQ